MDITQLVVSRRNDALLVGDYGSYRQKLTRRLLTLRRHLGRTSPKGKKYASKAPVTAEDIASNPEFVQLVVLTAERAWAHAMSMKSMHAADAADKAITGSTKKHIVSRLRRAAQHAVHLVKILEENPGGVGSATVQLEAMAYEAMLRGALNFEAQKWETSLAAYSDAYLAYNTLLKNSGAAKGDCFQDLLTSTVEPSLRYAGYQLRLPRTLSMERMVSRYARKESPVVREALKLDPAALDSTETATKQEQSPSAGEVPKDIKWRQRTVPLEDAATAQALGAAAAGEAQLQQALSDASLDVAARAAAYDSVLNPSQDAVDATTTALAELTADGVATGDRRMQALQITRTATNYALVGWRIGRNRVLCGRDDGAHAERFETPRNKKQPTTTTSSSSSQQPQQPQQREVGKVRQLNRLREREALYDSTLQSLDSVQALPGVAGDAALLKELASRRAYFAALRCCNVAHGYAALGAVPEALALYARALGLAQNVRPDEGSTSTNTAVPNLTVAPDQARFLVAHLQALTDQHRALAQLALASAQAEKAEKAAGGQGGGKAEQKDKAAAAAASAHPHEPWAEYLHDYPEPGKAVDLTRLVDYPPRLRPVPAKPIFLDLAWNYVDYPGREGAPARLPERPAAQPERAATPAAEDERGDERKGWFSSWRR